MSCCGTRNRDVISLLDDDMDGPFDPRAGAGREGVRDVVRQLMGARGPALRTMDAWWLATHEESGKDKWISGAGKTGWLDLLYGKMLRNGDRVPVGESLVLMHDSTSAMVLTMVRLSFTWTKEIQDGPLS